MKPIDRLQRSGCIATWSASAALWLRQCSGAHLPWRDLQKPGRWAWILTGCRNGNFN